MEYYTGSVYYKKSIRHIMFGEGSITENYVTPQTLNLFPISIERLVGVEKKYCFISPKTNQYVTNLNGVSQFTAGLIKKLPYGYPIPTGGRVCFIPCKKFDGYVGYELKGVGCLNKNLWVGRPEMKENTSTGALEAEFKAWNPHEFFKSGGRGFFTMTHRTIEVNGGFLKKQAAHEFENLSSFNKSCIKSDAPPSDLPLFVSEVPEEFFTKDVSGEEQKLFDKNLNNLIVKENGGLAVLGRAVTTPVRFSWLYDPQYRRQFYDSLGISGTEEKRGYLLECLKKFTKQLLVLLKNAWYHSSLHAQNVRVDGGITDFSDVHKIEDMRYAAGLMASHVKSLMTDSALFAPDGKSDEALVEYFLMEMFGKVAPEDDVKKYAKLFAHPVYYPWKMSAGHHFLTESFYKTLLEQHNRV